MLEVTNLTKSFRTNCVIDHLNMTVADGAIYGFVGPNGAGKTTTMKLLSGLLGPDAGTIILNGTDIRKYPMEAKKMIGYMPDFFGVYDNLKVYEYMKFFASIYGIYGVESEKRMKELLELVHLSGEEHQFVDELSRGMKQRLCLARSLIHHPQLLILDEPAAGLEPRSRIELREIFLELHEKKIMILLSSHLLTELSDLCTHIGVIESGKMVIEGDIKVIMEKQQAQLPMYLKVLDNPPKAIACLKKSPLVSKIVSKQCEISFQLAGTKQEEVNLLKQLVQEDVTVLSYYRDHGNLEELFLQLTN